ncbi:MAG: DNA translocase FtsK, partial [Oscillospiraceae bacterium]
MPAKHKTSKRKTQAQQRAHNQTLAIVLCTLGLLFVFLALVRGTAGWQSAHNVLLGLFGPAAFFIGPVFVYISIMASLDKLADDLSLRAGLTLLLLLMIAAACQIFLAGQPAAETPAGVLRELYAAGQLCRGGGVASALFGLPLLLLGAPGDRIAVGLILFALLMIITKSTLAGVLRTAKKPVDKLHDGYQELVASIPSRAAAPERERSRAVIDIPLEDKPSKAGRSGAPVPPADSRLSRSKKRLLDTAIETAGVPVSPEHPVEPTAEPAPIVPDEGGKQIHIDDIIQRMAQQEAERQQTLAAEKDKPADPPPPPPPPPAPPIYIMPPLTLLREPRPTLGEDTSEELRQNAQRLVDTLQSFGVQTRIIDISRGPAVTRYELQPSAGVKISKITNLADDIALNLAAAGVRIEAPIPNKAAVGIEVPNRTVSPVTLREVIDSPTFTDAKSKVTVALGRDISGNVTVTDIAKMPHLLIAGATGSGKSVCINSIIMSILYKARPDEVKLMLVDPKVVELGVYNGLPHLVVPVVSDAKKAAGLLSWAVNEMLQRYKIFAQSGARDIASFNKLAESQEALTALPHIVIVIDELADLMMVAPTEVEDYICRLAQMARAAGMHLIIATQRPSVDVITGVIKANIPSRIAFAVSSQVDSRTILDMGGAEKLLGAGDMLFSPVGSAKPIRVQGCFVSDDEIE